MAKPWTFVSIEDEKEIPPEAADARDEVLAKWIARFHLMLEGGEVRDSKKKSDTIVPTG